MDLKCKKLDCVFNNKYNCEARGITIKHNLNCGTFQKNHRLTEEQQQDVSKTMFEVAPEFHAFRHNQNVNIKCRANRCVFNEDGNCISNGITLQQTDKKAYCATSLVE